MFVFVLTIHYSSLEAVIILTVCDSTTNDTGEEKQMSLCSEQEALVTDDP